MNLHELFAKLDQEGSWLKMSGGYCQTMMDGTLEKFLETWPTSGMMRNGVCAELVNQEPHIHGRGCSLFPTPQAADGMGGLCWNDATAILKDKGHRRPSGFNIQSTLKVHIPLLEIKDGRSRTGGKINPELSEWLMGWPLGWTALDALETEWFHNSRSRRGKGSKS